MIVRLPSLLLAMACLAASAAHAEKADRDKPINIDADRMTVDDKNKVHIFEGKVVLTQGTLTLRAERLVVTQDANGFQRGVASGGGSLARIRQKREGKDEYMEGEAERIEYDSKLEQTEMFRRAVVRSGRDEVRGEYIFVDGKTENYTATSGPNGTSTATQGGRVRAILQSSKTRNGGAGSPSTPELKPSLAPANQ